MIRLSRLTDYGIVLMSHMARDPEGVHTAAEIAGDVHVSLPTTSKLLRTLAKGGLLVSHRGVKGGYGLARDPGEISVADVIRVLEGPIALTVCSDNSGDRCEHEGLCRVRGHWQHIDRAIRTALEEISLRQMAGPLPGLLPVARAGREA